MDSVKSMNSWSHGLKKAGHFRQMSAMEVWSQYFIEVEPALSNFLSFLKSNFVCGLNMVAFAVFPEWLKLFSLWRERGLVPFPQLCPSLLPSLQHSGKKELSFQSINRSHCDSIQNYLKSSRLSR